MSPDPRPSYEDLESRIAELEQTLQESRRPLEPGTIQDPDLLQTIFDTIEQPIAFVSQKYRYQAVNKAYSHYFAREREQILGRSVAELCGHSVFESEIRPNLNRCLGGETVVYEVQMQFPGKGLRWMEMEYIPHRNERGEILGVIAHGQDITRRKASDSELQDREADNQALLNATHDGVVLLDRQGTILVANQAYAQRFGLTPLNMTGECLWDVLPQQVIPRRKAKVEEVFATGQPRRMVDEREGLWNDTILYPIFDPQGNVAKVAVDARDITEHKRMEEDLRLALEKACQRKQELDGLLNVAHEVLKYTSFAEAAPAILQTFRRQIGVHLAFLAVLPPGGTRPEALFFDPHQAHPPGIDVTELSTSFKNELLSGDPILTTQSIPASLKSSWDEDNNPQAHLLLIPLRIEEATTGMLGLVGSSEFSPETVRLATGYSELAGTALRNSRTLSLLREMNTELENRVEERTEALTRSNAELQQTMQALRENEERFTAFMDHFPGGTFIKEVNGPIIFRNQYLKNVFEKNRSWLGQTTHEILPDSVAQAILEDEQHLSQASPRTREFSIPDRRGRTQVVELHKFLIKQTGKPDLIGGIGLDVTEKKDTRKKLQKSRALLQAVFDGISDPLFMVDETLTIRMLNKAAAAYIGASYVEAIGLDCVEAFACQAGICEDCRITESIGAKDRICFERTGCFDAHKLEQVNIYPLGSETALEADGAVVHIRDITLAKKQEQELQQADKMISLGILVSGVAHEINNPNNFIMLNTPLLQEIWDNIQDILVQSQQERGELIIAGLSYPELQEKVPLLFAGIVEGSQRIKAIVQGLKDFSRQEPQNLQTEVDVNQVVEQSVLLLKNMIQQAGANFRLHLDPDLPCIQGDAQKLEQVVVNLIQNACQALPAPDKALAVQTVSDPQLHSIRIVVSDEGEGIPQESLPRIMDPFFTTRRTTGGTGIGLSVSQNIVKEHGGSIEVESQIGSGTTFQVILPLEKLPVKTVKECTLHRNEAG